MGIKGNIGFTAKVIAISIGMLHYGNTLNGITFSGDIGIAEAKALPETVEDVNCGQNSDDKIVTDPEPAGMAWNYYDVPYGDLNEEVQEYIHDTCNDYEIPVELVLAIIDVESRYEQYATGDDGRSYGYMQVMKECHVDRMHRLGVDDLYDAYGNILVAVDYLAECFELYDEEHVALMIYNCGYGTASWLWSRGIYSTEYTWEVIATAERIQNEISGE